MSEQTKGLADEGLEWPPPVVGQVRLRLMTDITAADLRGPTACVLQTPERCWRRSRGSGPTRWSGTRSRMRSGSFGRSGRSRRSSPCFSWTSLRRQRIGNVYRAEMLYRQRLNPHHSGSRRSGRGRARALARLGATAGDRRRDRPDDDDGRSHGRGLPRRDGEPRRPALGVSPGGAPVPGLWHGDRHSRRSALASCTGARAVRRDRTVHPRIRSRLIACDRIRASRSPTRPRSAGDRDEPLGDDHERR